MTKELQKAHILQNTLKYTSDPDYIKCLMCDKGNCVNFESAQTITIN